LCYNCYDASTPARHQVLSEATIVSPSTGLQNIACQTKQSISEFATFSCLTDLKAFLTPIMHVNVYREVQEASSHGGCLAAFDFYNQVFGGAFPRKPQSNQGQTNEAQFMTVPIGKKFDLILGLDASSRQNFNNEKRKGTNKNHQKALTTQRICSDDCVTRKGSRCSTSPCLSLWLTVGSKDEAERISAELSAHGGTVEVPISETSSNDYIGGCTDGFGTRWRISCNPNSSISERSSSLSVSETPVNVSLYRIFQGNCAEAFEFYKRIFGGEFLWKTTWANSPTNTVQNKSDESKIMHVSLQLTQDFVLMGCDSVVVTNGKTCPYNNTVMDDELSNRNDDEHPQGNGDNACSMSLAVESRKDVEDLIAKLSSDGGTIEVPVADQFWGDYFGKCIDRFGTQWMVSHNQECTTAKAILERNTNEAVDFERRHRSSDMTMCIYRNFHGNCNEAFHFYRQVFGGDFIWMATWVDPLNKKEPNHHDFLNSNAKSKKIMHIGLLLTDDVKLIGCDDVPSSDDDDLLDTTLHQAKKRQKMTSTVTSTSIRPSPTVSAMPIPLVFPSMEQAERVLNALGSNGGVVQMPLSQKTIGDYCFGMCVDRFGTPWMIRFPPTPIAKKPKSSATRRLRFQS
jgi:PhnB protein